MRKKSFDEQAREHLVASLKRSGHSFASAGRAIGLERSDLARKLRGERPLKLTEISALLEKIDHLSAGEFLSSLLDHLAPDRETRHKDFQSPLDLAPSYYARHLAAAAPTPLSPTELEHLKWAQLSLADRRAIPQTTSIEPPNAFSELIERINSHPKVGFELARAEVGRSVENAQSSPESLLAHASLVNAWACAALRVGKINLASALTRESLEMHGAASLSPTFPPLLRTTATLFFELGKRSHALGTAQHALLVSSLAEGEIGKVHSALTLSNIYTVYGFAERALQILQSLLPVPEHVAFRVHYNLALLSLTKGNLGDTKMFLKSASPSNRHEELHSEWLLAKTLFAQGELAEALLAYDKLLATSEGHFQPSQRLLIFLDLVPMLEEGSSDTIALLAGRLLPDLESLENNEAANRLRADVIEAATRGTLRPGFGADFRKRLAQET